MKPGLLIGIGCGAILGAAVWFSFSASEPAVAPVAEVKPRAPVAPTPTRAMVREDELPSAPPAPEKTPEAVAVEARPGTPLPPAPIAAPPPPVDVPEEPPALRFKGLSRELDYADNLLGKANPTVEEVRSANDVFARCVEVDPENVRCAESLERAQLALATMSRSRRSDPSFEGARVLGPTRDLPQRLPAKR